MRLDEIHIRDPFLLEAEGTYYLYGTRGPGCWSSASGFDVYVSQDLADWSAPISVFERPEGFWADRQFWAPEVHRYGGNYYMLASFKAQDHCRGTQILAAGSPLGPFVPLTPEPVTPRDWECLDGTLYVSSQGQPYLVFCHEWLQVHDGEICALALSQDLTQAVGAPLLLFRGSDPGWAEPDPQRAHVTDGPFLYRTREGRLLMLWSTLSHGDHGSYIQALSYSGTGEITGPWRHFAKPLYENDGGHGMVLSTKDGQLLLSLHRPNQSPLERPRLIPLREAEGTLVPLGPD